MPDNLRQYSASPLTNPNTQRFIFASGIECSYPTIHGGRTRMDEMKKAGHYDRWREDFRCTCELGIQYLRYGPPYYRMHLGAGKYDWGWTDQVLPELRRLGIVPILDLCHFGVPDWIGNFQNPDFPRLFAEYAAAFAERYPWVWCYTPVNEMYICAQFSGYYGWWNEQMSSDVGFVTAIKHMARAAVLAMVEILQRRPHALFVLCESSEVTHPRTPELVPNATLANERRFLSLDFTTGRRVSSGMYAYLLDYGMTEQEYLFFMKHRLVEHFVLGTDYYETNDHLMVEPHKRVFRGDMLGYYPVALQYYNRYNLPVMHTETNVPGERGPDWLWKTWINVQQLRKDGVPLCGMTWYSITHQVDWDTALREDNNHVYPVGLYDLDRKITPVGKAYKELIELWRDTPLLPNGPLTLFGNWGDRQFSADGRDQPPQPPMNGRDQK